MLRCILVLALIFLPVPVTGSSTLTRVDLDWSPVDKILTAAIANGTFPGCAAAVTTPDGDVVLLRGYGSFVFSGQTTPG